MNQLLNVFTKNCIAGKQKTIMSGSLALFSASERMAEEFKRNNPEFDREKFVKAFSE